MMPFDTGSLDRESELHECAGCCVIGCLMKDVGEYAERSVNSLRRAVYACTVGAKGVDV